jgi:hypothetical protein
MQSALSLSWQVSGNVFHTFRSRSERFLDFGEWHTNPHAYDQEFRCCHIETIESLLWRNMINAHTLDWTQRWQAIVVNFCNER